MIFDPFSASSLDCICLFTSWLLLSFEALDCVDPCVFANPYSTTARDCARTPQVLDTTDVRGLSRVNEVHLATNESCEEAVRRIPAVSAPAPWVCFSPRDKLSPHFKLEAHYKATRTFGTMKDSGSKGSVAWMSPLLEASL